MQVQALRRLLTLHLQVARGLQLLDATPPAEIDAFVAEPGAWDDPDLPPVNRLGTSFEAAEARFHDRWRLRCCRLGEELALHRVVRLGDLGYMLRETAPTSRPALQRIRAEFTLLRPELDRRHDPADGDSAHAIGRASQLAAELQAEIADRAASPYRVPARAIHAPGSCWVARPTGRPAAGATAQGYRDRLGLHHYPKDGTIGDQLVLLQVRLGLSDTACPPAFDPALADTRADGAWLLRPTVRDLPNARFSQGHGRDQPGAPAATGSTIDIGADDYPEGDEELILLAGRDVELRLQGVELLPGGPPVRHPRDDDHVIFAGLLAARLKGLS